MLLSATAGLLAADPQLRLTVLLVGGNWQLRVLTEFVQYYNHERPNGPPERDRGFAAPQHYCASKWGVLGLMKSLAIDLAPHHITVNAVCPASVKLASIPEWPNGWVSRKSRSLSAGLPYS